METDGTNEFYDWLIHTMNFCDKRTDSKREALVLFAWKTVTAIDGTAFVDIPWKDVRKANLTEWTEALRKLPWWQTGTED